MTNKNTVHTMKARTPFVRLLLIACFTHALLPGAENTAPATAPGGPAAAKPVVAMPGPLARGSLELLAITAHPSEHSYVASQPWWTADGAPTHNYALAKSESLMIRSTTHQDTYELYFLAPNLPAGASWTLSGLSSPDVLRAFSISPREKPAPGTMAFVGSAPWGTEFVDLTVGIAAGDWETIAKLVTDKHGSDSSLISTDYSLPGGMQIGEGSVSGNLAHGTKVWSVSMFVPGLALGAPDPKGNARITVIHNVNIGSWNKNPVDWAVRVIAADQTGQEFFPATIEDAETSAFVHATYVFDQLTLAQTKEFRLQVRPFQSAEFHHVALKPKPASPVQKP